MSTAKRTFKKIGEIPTGDFSGSQACLVITDRDRLHEANYTNKNDLALRGNQFVVAKDDSKVPFAIAVNTAQASDSVFYPIFLEIEEDADGKETIVSIRVHLHPKSKDREKAPRIHSKK